MQALCLWKAHLKYWSGTTITPTPTRLSAEAGAAKADAKLGSSTKERLRGLAGGLETSNLRGKFTGLRVTFVFRLLEEECFLLGPGGPRAGGATGTYSTRPSLTTSDILTPGLTLFHSEGCHRGTNAHLCPWQCDDATPPNPNRYPNQ